MKTVLLLGDSIRQNYQEYVEKELKCKAKVLFPRDNGRFCQFTLRYLHDWIRALTDGHGENIDIVHFNCGLWDVLRLSNENEPFTNENAYVELLKRIYNRIVFLCPNAKVVFALTTSVIEPGFEPGSQIGERKNEDIVKYNYLAMQLFRELNVEIDDLWTISENLPPTAHSDLVHFDTKQGITQLGNQVCSCLLKYL